MKKHIIVTVAAVVISGAFGTPLIGRGPGILKPLQFIAELDLSYTQTAKNYKWDERKWESITDAKKKTTTVSGMLLLGMAPLKNWEVLLMAPVARKSKDTLISFGLGDVEFHTRYGILTGKLMPIKLTAVAGIGLPTADKNANPVIGDGKFAGALGLIAATKQFGSAVGNLRFAYWFNGKKDDTTKVGNMFEYVAKVDFKVSKMVEPFLTLAGTMQGRTEINGVAKEKTEQDRHNLQVGTVVKPIPFLYIRPKVAIPLNFMCRGGSMPNFNLGLDFWVILP